MSPTLRRARTLYALRNLYVPLFGFDGVDWAPRPRPYDWERDGALQERRAA